MNRKERKARLLAEREASARRRAAASLLSPYPHLLAGAFDRGEEVLCPQCEGHIPGEDWELHCKLQCTEALTI